MARAPAGPCGSMRLTAASAAGPPHPASATGSVSCRGAWLLVPAGRGLVGAQCAHPGGGSRVLHLMAACQRAWGAAACTCTSGCTCTCAHLHLQPCTAHAPCAPCMHRATCLLRPACTCRICACACTCTCLLPSSPLHAQAPATLHRPCTLRALHAPRNLCLRLHLHLLAALIAPARTCTCNPAPPMHPARTACTAHLAYCALYAPAAPVPAPAPASACCTHHPCTWESARTWPQGFLPMLTAFYPGVCTLSAPHDDPAIMFRP